MVQVEHSKEEDNVAIVDLITGTAICVGIVLSFLPQHLSCLQQRSSQGLSLATINFATLSTTTRTLAAWLGDASRIAPNARGDIISAINVAMPTLQAFLAVLPGLPTYTVYYFWFYPTEQDVIMTVPLNVSTRTDDDWVVAPLVTTRPSSAPLSDEGVVDCIQHVDNRTMPVASTSSTRRQSTYYARRKNLDIAATVVTWNLVILAVLASVVSLLVRKDEGAIKQGVIRVLGSLATLANAVMWIPQIVTTYQQQHEGVLSVAALLFSALGDVLLGAYWIVSGETVWVWGSLVADSSMQLTLIGQILVYRWRRRSVSQVASDHDGASAMNVPLLGAPEQAEGPE
jgi:uncharacterized protein with PQ loop repeat